MINYMVQVMYPLTITWSNTEGVFIRCTECVWCTPVILGHDGVQANRPIEQAINHCTNNHLNDSGTTVEVFPAS
jgi:hypothetical protein